MPIWVGPDGSGAPGPPGPPGPASSCVLEWGADITVGLPLGFRSYLLPGYGFIAPIGLALAGTAPEYRVSRAGTIQRLRVRCRGAGAGAGLATTYRLIVNGAPTALGVTMLDTLQDAADLVNAVPVAAGDLLALEVSRIALQLTPQTGIVVSVELA